MKLPADAVIAPDKLTRYLLVSRNRDDKSKYLATAGYTLDNWYQLERDLRTQILIRDAIFEYSDEYGDRYRITGKLLGPNGQQLCVVTYWMFEKQLGQVKFITLIPDKTATP